MKRKSVRLLVCAAFVAVLVGSAAETAGAATNNPAGGVVPVYNPIIDGDAVHNDVSSWWAWGASTAPASHHIVYSNWGFKNDWAIDVFAKAANKRIVTPFGSKTTGGDGVRSVVVGLKPGCASGNPSDGGYRVTVEARNVRTGQAIARADVMHVARPQVRVGQALGSWTAIGYTSQFRYNSCYQVRNPSGIHVHLEVINRNRYACWRRLSYNQALTELTWIGRAGTNNSGQRAAC